MSAYRALARKYRSRHFGELIGQDVLVRTLSNAIENDRLHHAYLFTGIRGTGKTSTARILAKAINYVGPNGDGKPTTGPTDDCPICQAIGEDRHPDVIEIDAASNTGVDDVRQIIDNVRYAPVQARYKVFIIDEVHMLSKAAFNALLKTLEEPPPHVVFMLATTEIRKVPVTILSRCQRFDLRRIDVPTLTAHYANIAQKENISIDPEALELIARAADGSARDGLSIFDQAIAQSHGETITLANIRSMLGQVDRHAVVDLFGHLAQGKIADVLAHVQNLYTHGGDPAMILDDILNFTHVMTRLKISNDGADTMGLGSDVFAKAQALAAQLQISTLSRIWQMLLKAVSEVAQAPQPQQALEMALIRIGFAAPLPPLEELLKKAQKEESAAPTPPSGVQEPSAGFNAGPAAKRVLAAVPVSTAAIVQKPIAEIQEMPPQEQSATIMVPDFAALVDLCDRNNEPMLAADLYANVRVVKFQQGKLEIVILPGAAKDLTTILPKKLHEWTGQRWLISVASQGGQASLAEQAKARKADMIERAYADPAIRAITQFIPNITITDIVTEN